VNAVASIAIQWNILTALYTLVGILMLLIAPDIPKPSDLFTLLRLG
jgi:hypothetical protein